MSLNNMNKEQHPFVPIRGYEEKYEINDLGEIRHRENKELRIHQSNKGSPYKYIMVWHKKTKTRKKLYIHRLLALHFIPNPYQYNEINHIDGNKTNCAIENLEWVSRSQNALHAIRTGLSLVHFVKGQTAGENNFNAKLTWESVDKIRYLHKEEGVSIKELAALFNVSYGAVYDIIRGRRWKKEN